MMVWSVVTTGIFSSRGKARMCPPAVATVDAEFMLEEYDIDVADVEEIRSAEAGLQILFFDLKPYDFRILIAAGDIVHGN